MASSKVTDFIIKSKNEETKQIMVQGWGKNMVMVQPDSDSQRNKEAQSKSKIIKQNGRKGNLLGVVRTTTMDMVVCGGFGA